ncbi:tRNA glutamyl-Q(34) synthetase GluQRS [Spiribacter pallidus]|jgi:glutamyl-Q tRNA(Asp) synthetase|uniref:Glutamyl-Q tRNA(Asp) synthetase n=1 Tax=Spiribacter pallidus TaxID=1987936 RepID=A0ABV3TBN8_9GAMM
MDDTRYVGRFAPSPTGPLHFGSLVAALASYLDARANQGRWHLRIDDVDRGRARADARQAIIDGLARLGLHWDGEIVDQSRQTHHYQAALERLQSRAMAYPCGCTRRAVMARARRGPAGMIYPGTCRDGLPPGTAARSWRFRSPERAIEFHDRCMGQQSIQLDEAIGDFVIRRGDGLHAYHLAMVVDDARLGVTDIVRGADLLPATAPQIALQQALALPTPRYLHIPVATDHTGRKLSKTNGAAAIDPASAPALLCRALAFLGQMPPQKLERAAPSAILDWAVAHWRTEAIPRHAPL